MSRVLYLNHVGVTLTPGTNDSFAQTSTIVTERADIAPWNSDLWPDVMSCMQEIWAPFDVTITDVDPGSTPHVEAVFADSPTDLGLDADIAGVSPFTSDCGIIDNSIVFAFTASLPADARQICEVTAQELAHSYGLDHEMLASDPMTYLDYNGDRSFQDATVSCGEFTARPCGINGSTCRANQDSVALLTERVGLAGDPSTGSSASNGAGGDDDGEITGGCSADGHGGNGGGAALAVGLGLAVAGLIRRRR
jgi:MYXO-CTERM domain-containing protein